MQPRTCSLLVHLWALRAQRRGFNAFFLRKECFSGFYDAHPARKQSKITFALRKQAFCTASAPSHCKGRIQIHRLAAGVLRRQICSHIMECAFVLLYGYVRQCTFAHLHVQKCKFRCGNRHTKYFFARFARKGVYFRRPSMSSPAPVHHGEAGKDTGA